VRCLATGALVLVIFAAGCTNSDSPGSVQGVALQCIGVATATQLRGAIPVTVTLADGNKDIATDVVRGDQKFHFTAAAGEYLLTSSAAPALAPTKVVIRSGRSSHINLSPGCKTARGTLP
jgi:microcystin-dependent protein